MTAQNDAAFLRMFLLVLGALVAFTVIILFIANVVTATAESERGEDPRLRAAIADRIAPVGRVNVAGAPAVVEQAAPAADAGPRSGEAIVTAACASCHVSGVLNSPRIGDEAAWAQRLDAAGGLDALTASAIKGKGMMPARGGAAASDAEIRAAVVHMLEQSGIAVDGAGMSATPAAETAAGPAGIAETVKAAAAPALQAVADDARQMVANAGQAVSDVAAGVSSMVASAMPEAAQPAPSQPVADAPAAAALPAFDLAQGKAIYDSACFACHATGAAGAPKLGDTAAWAPRIAQGHDAMFTSAINGKGGMPPKGGRVDLSDDAIKSAVAYMLGAVQ